MTTGKGDGSGEHEPVDCSIVLPGGLNLDNPTLLASGILDSTAGILSRMARSGAGALITKSLSLEPRPGYAGPTAVEPWPGVLLNAMGLPNPGIEAFLNEVDLEGYPVPIIPNVVGVGPGEYIELVNRAGRSGASLVELNLSCPHHSPGKVKIISQDAKATKGLVSDIAGSTDIAVMAKLTPNVTDIGAVAVACAEAGAEAISTINTLEALDIDPDLERPVLGNCYGGLSGRAIRPIALRKVAECRMALDEAGHASVPVIAIGGAATGRDLARFILVGAHGVQMGTAARNDHQVFSRAVEELGAWMAGKGYRRLEDFRGQALEWLR